MVKIPYKGHMVLYWLQRKKYSINVTEQQKKICLRLQYNELNSYLFVKGLEIYKFKGKNSEINTYILYLGNFS